jgi:CDP-glucose 4,6-dehydratase
MDTGEVASIFQGKKILVTGHTGFKGTWLTLLLEKYGLEVTGISLEPEPGCLYEALNRKGAISEYFIDIRNRTSLEAVVKSIKPQIVFHLAAQPLVLKSYQDPLGTFETNVIGTANLLNSLINLATTEVIAVATTDKVYENHNLGIRFKETDSMYGNDPYSASKVGTESTVSAWRKLSQLQEGPRIVSLRAGNVVGGGDAAENRLLPDLAKGFIEDRDVEIRNPDSTRPWQHALDPLHGYILAVIGALGGKKQTAYNFGPLENSMKVRDVVEIAARAWPSRKPVRYLENNSDSEAVTLDLDSRLATEELGWRPSWTQEESIVSTINWWKSTSQKELTPIEACRVDLKKITDGM